MFLNFFKMFYFMRAKKKEGRPLPETTDMKIWREEFDQMSLDDHHSKLKALGLGEDDIREFDEELKETMPQKKKNGK